MSDLTREQIEEYRSPTRPVPPGRADAICDMALCTLDAEARIRELEAALRDAIEDARRLKSIYKHQGDRVNAAATHARLLHYNAVLAKPPPDSEPNQCDGCRRGLPVKDGMHVDQDELPFMVCSADRYDYEPPERCGDCGKLVLDLSQHDCGVGDEPAEGGGPHD